MLIRTINNVARSTINFTRSISSTVRCQNLNAGSDFSPSSNASSDSENAAKQLKRTTATAPVIIQRELQFKHMFNEDITPPREAWVESFNSPQGDKLSVIPLHPSVFAAFPRPDLIARNVEWQKRIHSINYLHLKTRAELNGSTKKPWPQKGTGRARHGSRRAPQWKNGGWCNGPRGPMTRYYLLPFFTRVRGLTSTLSAKFAQNDFKIIDRLDDFPSDEPEVLLEFLEKREWGPSVLFVDKSDVFPRNISLAAHNLTHINLMPVYSLNINSMLKHETLVITMAALDELESKLLYHFNRTDLDEIVYKHETPPLIPKDYPELEGVRWWTNLHQKDW